MLIFRSGHILNRTCYYLGRSQTCDLGMSPRWADNHIVFVLLAGVEQIYSAQELHKFHIGEKTAYKYRMGEGKGIDTVDLTMSDTTD